MTEQWQLYDAQGQPLAGQGATKDEVFTQGLLHGAAHVWIWHRNDDGIEVLLQKRAAAKRTWPNCYDVSAAGHIRLGEAPLTAALREAKEEIGLTVDVQSLQLITVYLAYMTTAEGAIENEFNWVYLLEAPGDTAFSLQEAEVDSLIWQPLDMFARDCQTVAYVPHGQLYYGLVIEHLTTLQSAGQVNFPPHAR